MTTRSETRHEIRGWHVLTAMIVFFAAIIAINVAFTVAAVRSFPGEDVRRSYLQGLHYNQTLADRRAQAQLGWRASAMLAGEGEDAQLLVTMHDRSGAPLDQLSIEGALRWPMDARRDRALQFRAEGNGLYRATLGRLARGHWRLRAHAANEQGQALDIESEMTWRP